MDLCDKYTKQLKTDTNADTPHDAEVARHSVPRVSVRHVQSTCSLMHQKIVAMCQYVFGADPVEGREKALAKPPYQKADFYGILKAYQWLPRGTSAWLTPPLHEFVPRTIVVG